MNIQLLKELLTERISKQTNIAAGSIELSPVGGGSINNCYKLITSNKVKFFLKLNSALPFQGLFEKEKNGLRFLASQKCIRIPSVILCESVGDHQLLVLEWIESGNRNNDTWRLFGEQLARLHYTSNDHFGFAEDNYMGALPQANNHVENWIDFFINYRIRPQIELAENKKLLDKSHISSFEALFKRLNSIINIEKITLSLKISIEEFFNDTLFR